MYTVRRVFKPSTKTTAFLFSALLLFKIDGKPVEFADLHSTNALLSRACAQTAKCQAALALPRASLKNIDLRSSANPGALICEKLQGRTVIGTNRAGNQNAFCRFPDGSLVSCGSLHANALTNDRKR